VDDKDLIASNLEIAALKLTYCRLFSTPDGKAVMNDLKKNFYAVAICDENQLMMAAKAARHDLIQGILNLMEEKNEL
jgi:hypothetical protein